MQAPATLPRNRLDTRSRPSTRVVDGDTIEVRIEERVEGPAGGEGEPGETYDVRLIGIDTPESVKPDTPVECFAKEASAATKALLEGESVRLVKDVEETDRYERLLSYVYIGEEMANARLVANGYAYAYTYPPNIRHSNVIRAAATRSQRERQRTVVPRHLRRQALINTHGPRFPGTRFGGPDEIDGTPDADVIYAAGGDDAVHGHEGEDLLCGGEGSDSLSGDGGRDSLYGDEGSDSLDAGLGSYSYLFGGPGEDALQGGPGADHLYGGDDDDVMRGGPGPNRSRDM